MVFFVIINLILLSFIGQSSFASDEDTFQLSHTITIDSFDIVDLENGHEITLQDFGWLLLPGKPKMPSKIFSLALPSNAQVKEVLFDYGEVTFIEGSFLILPVPDVEPINGDSSTDNAGNMALEFDDVYDSNNAYPDVVGEYLGPASFRSYNLVDVRINPFVYYPLSQQLAYYPEISITVKYTLNQDDVKSVQVPEKSSLFASHFISNFDSTFEWYETVSNQKGLYDFVIITLDSLTSSVSSLVDWEESKGRTVNVVTTSWIDSNYDGYDLQEKMRNFLREKYPQSEWGIQDVLLVGHYDDVPMRRCDQNMGYGKPETDYYYAELSLPDSESWDSNGNHEYGEDADSIDFYAEINVGRIPSSDPDMVSSICDKSVDFEQNDDPEYKKNILLLGCFFWPDTDNAVLMEEIASQDWMQDWTKTRMYEESQSSYDCDYDINYNNVLDDWSSETYSFVNWAGHGSPTACFEYYPSTEFVDTDTCDSLNDDYPAIIFADACSNQDTDEYNIGQAMMEQGAIGFLGATKVAYGTHGWDDPYDGSTQSFDYFFTTYVTSGEYTTGEAHQLALIDMYNNGLWYYQNFETFEWGAYLGNPDISYTVIPDPTLGYDPSSFDFGVMDFDETSSTSFKILNEGSGTLNYSLSESESWIEVTPLSGESSGEMDSITVSIDTTGLSVGAHHGDIQITSTGGSGSFAVDVYVMSDNTVVDVEQSLFDRGFRLMPGWDAAQAFVTGQTLYSHIDLYMAKFGNPGQVTFELRKDSLDGALVHEATIDADDVPNVPYWGWYSVDLSGVTLESGETYFIILHDATSADTHNCINWGWCDSYSPGSGGPYDGGWFYFRKEGNPHWSPIRDWDYTFTVYSLI
jgi:hypothetical protein